MFFLKSKKDLMHLAKELKLFGNIHEMSQRRSECWEW